MTMAFLRMTVRSSTLPTSGSEEYPWLAEMDTAEQAGASSTRQACRIRDALLFIFRWQNTDGATTDQLLLLRCASVNFPLLPAESFDGFGGVAVSRAVHPWIT